jgi:glutamyl-tRNA synthetase
VAEIPAYASNPDVRVRFCPSPTGNPHVGMVRTALFNWAYARHTGGTFVFRIEDTDSARDTETSYNDLLDALRWLGLDWDEGPEVGGPHGPYRQSERLAIYGDVAARLQEAGLVYPCYCTPEELEDRREKARAAGRPPGYEGTCRDLDSDQRGAFEAEGRRPALRFRMTEQEWTWNDLVRGDVTFAREHVPDYVMVRANGEPLYTLTNPVDDALMEITHVLRGEDLLSSTPRQLALYDAFAKIGLGNGNTPLFGHLPYVMGEGNRKLSKRDPESSLGMYRENGYLPEGLLNYLALLGWSPGEDREFFSAVEMAEVFEVSRVNPSPARFDIKKCTAINADWVRALAPDDLAGRLDPYLVKAGLLLAGDDPRRAVVAAAVPLVQERMQVLTEVVDLLRFLLIPEGEFVVDPTEAARSLGEDSRPTIAAAVAALEPIDDWVATVIESALRTSLVEGLGLKPKLAFGPVRVATTGARISPPLFESLELLGKQRSLLRLRAALA